MENDGLILGHIRIDLVIVISYGVAYIAVQNKDMRHRRQYIWYLRELKTGAQTNSSRESMLRASESSYFKL